MHSDVGKQQVTIPLFKGIYHCFHGVRLIPVATVQDSDDVPFCQTDSLIHGIIDAGIRFG